MTVIPGFKGEKLVKFFAFKCPSRALDLKINLTHAAQKLTFKIGS